jgi:hypothetical protein
MRHVVLVTGSRSGLLAAILFVVATLLPLSALAQTPASGQPASQIVTCVSQQGGRQVCPANTAAGVALLRSTGDASCLLGEDLGI